MTASDRAPYTQGRFRPANTLQASLSGGRTLKTLRTRDLALLGMAVVLTTFGTTLGQSQGALKGKVLPVVSTSDVIGYITPCG